MMVGRLLRVLFLGVLVVLLVNYVLDHRERLIFRAWVNRVAMFLVVFAIVIVVYYVLRASD